METVRNLKNNNQNFSANQNGIHISNSGRIYVCIPHNLNCTTAKKNKEKVSSERDPLEEPIDLTCSIRNRNRNPTAQEILQPQPNIATENDVKKKDSNVNIVSENGLLPVNGNNLTRKKGRKRKYETNHQQTLKDVPQLESNLSRNLASSESSQLAENKQAEVLKAAKSLFSKRTRTLYHWMYPDAPKTQLKAAVASSWETLATQEKEFYISQVLGRFGFPQTNLMVNPQLGSLLGSLSPLDLTLINEESNEEASSAVCGLLLSENDGGAGDGEWIKPQDSKGFLAGHTLNQRVIKKRGRFSETLGSRNKQQDKEEFAILKQIGEDSVGDEFRDDPELSREFEQFKLALHLNGSRGSKP